MIESKDPPTYKEAMNSPSLTPKNFTPPNVIGEPTNFCSECGVAAVSGNYCAYCGSLLVKTTQPVSSALKLVSSPLPPISSTIPPITTMQNHKENISSSWVKIRLYTYKQVPWYCRSSNDLNKWRIIIAILIALLLWLPPPGNACRCLQHNAM